MNSPLDQDPLLRPFPTIDGCKLLPPCLLYDKIGEGGYGVVYRARHLRLETEVAVKCLLLRPGRSGRTAVTRFEREARVAAGVDHPNLISVNDVREEQGLHYLVMEYVDGETIRDRITRLGPAPVEDAIAIIAAVAEALSVAHTRGIIHRDVKPDNVMVSKDGRVKLADLGLAKAAELQHGSSVTIEQSWLGTPGYMPPEQWEDASTVGTAADVYALGATLFFLLTGRDPLRAGRYAEMMRQAQALKCLDPSASRSGLPQEVIALVAHATARDVADRLRDMDQLLERLQPLPSNVSLADGAAGELRIGAGKPSAAPSYRTIVVARKRLSSASEAPPVVDEPEAVIEEEFEFAEAVHSPAPTYPTNTPPRAVIESVPHFAPVQRRVRSSKRRTNWTPVVMGIVMVPVLFFGWREWNDYKLERAAAAANATKSAADKSRDAEAELAEVEARKLEARKQEFDLSLANYDLVAARDALDFLENRRDASADRKRAELTEAERLFTEMQLDARKLNDLADGSTVPADRLREAQRLCDRSPVCCAKTGLNQALTRAAKSSADVRQELADALERWKETKGRSVAELAGGLTELRRFGNAARLQNREAELSARISSVALALDSAVKSSIAKSADSAAIFESLVDLDRTLRMHQLDDMPQEVRAAADAIRAELLVRFSMLDAQSLGVLLGKLCAWERETSDTPLASDRKAVREALLDRVTQSVTAQGANNAVSALRTLIEFLSVTNPNAEIETRTQARLLAMIDQQIHVLDERAASVNSVDDLSSFCDGLWSVIETGSSSDVTRRLNTIETRLIERAATLMESASIVAGYSALKRLTKWRDTKIGSKHEAKLTELASQWSSELEYRVLAEIDAALTLSNDGQYLTAGEQIRVLRDEMDDNHELEVKLMLARAEICYDQARGNKRNRGSWNIQDLRSAYTAYEFVWVMPRDYYEPDGTSTRGKAAERAADVADDMIEYSDSKEFRDFRAKALSKRELNPDK